MRIAMLASAGAIAFVCTIGSVSAADPSATPKQFSTLNGVKAVPMSSGELSSVKGMDHHFNLTPIGTGETTRHNTDKHQDGLVTPTDSRNFVDLGFTRVNDDGEIETVLVAPSYHGLQHACANAVISMPGFVTC